MNNLCGTVVISKYIVCHYGHFDYNCWTIQLQVGVASVQDTDKFFDQRLGCHSRGDSVNDVTCTVTTLPALRLGVFSLTFRKVTPAFLSTFLIDSGYKT